MFIKFFVVLIVSLFSTPLFADTKGPAVPNYPLDKLAENIYVIHGPITTPNPQNQGFMNNPGIILTSKGVVIVDPGGTVQSGEMVLRVLKTISNKPVVAVFNTHVHGDHWLANQAIQARYPNAPIYAHPETIKKIPEGAGQEWVQLMERSTQGKSIGTRIVAANHPINNSDKITIGDTSLTIHHYGVSHTDTDIMIAVDTNKALFMGDNLFNGRLPRTAEGHIGRTIEACEKIIKINPSVIIPGHGKSGGKKMFYHSLDVLRILYTTVRQQYELDLSDFEMKPVVVKALDKYKHWETFDSLVGKSISQAYLEIEQADF
ncbi:MAG: MBL fold metallo-hydrolase [Gammaproteobacteria bacterium]|jgi:glyoxylase-like metal-dependent hydrolase (beta-lactamase superfamily II)|nr:MBL fold metallo-hydrolase [Gammaproteobacteria bacterium]MBT3724285.1 MBL fold metallo-hydrolase [Gammaproteobacteria bacterium]MBT4078237.1 MBL fold metallo-hydrolase [Gammaproteobacteria bacterium]MBT4196702.1 MBL fold metallo-hydrolase [Gammaproteobacteria bacterium]MBT4448524.1 MBL fold metallo-hydrolase [Gammaproteobacteria bacterium]